MRDKDYYREVAFQKRVEKEFLENHILVENDHQLVEDVALLQYHKPLAAMSDEGLHRLFSALPSLKAKEIYKAVELFSELPNGEYKYSYQNIFYDTLIKKRIRPTSNASIYNNNIMDGKGTFAQVEDIFEDAAVYYDQESSSDYLLDDPEEEEHVVGIDSSLNPYITNNNKSGVKGTFVQVEGPKWELEHDFFADRSMMCQIEYHCSKVQTPYDSREDMLAEAFAQYAQMKAEGEITGEENAAYYARSAVNKMINKYKFDGRQKRKSVDTVPLAEPLYIDIEDNYGSFEEWYEGLTKSQKAAVNDAKYKLEKNQPMGNALRKRLRRVPEPAIGTTVQRFGSTNLREEYSYMRKDEQPEPREVTIVSKPVPKRTAKPTKLIEMIENGVSNRDLLIAISDSSVQHREPETAGERKTLPVNHPDQIGQPQMPIPASSVLQREPETAGEGKDMGINIQKPTVTNMNKLREQWQELLLEQIALDITEKELYAIKYKLEKYADCLILPKKFEAELQQLEINTENYKEIHEKLCSDTKREMKEAV